MNSVAYKVAKGLKTNVLWLENFCGKEEKQCFVLLIEIWKISFTHKMQVVNLLRLRRIGVSLCLCVKGIPEPRLRDVERAAILRFLCLYICEVSPYIEAPPKQLMYARETAPI